MLFLLNHGLTISMSLLMCHWHCLQAFIFYLNLFWLYVKVIRMCSSCPYAAIHLHACVCLYTHFCQLRILKFGFVQIQIHMFELIILFHILQTVQSYICIAHFV